MNADDYACHGAGCDADVAHLIKHPTKGNVAVCDDHRKLFLLGYCPDGFTRGELATLNDATLTTF